jgi:hypothetical protein
VSENREVSGFDDLERDLLRSAELLDVPSEGGKRRARALMTLGVAATVTASVSGPLASKTGLSLSLSPLWKSLLLGTVGVAVAAGTFFAVSTRSRTSPPASAAPSSVAGGATMAIHTPPEPPMLATVPAAPGQDPVSASTSAPPTPSSPVASHASRAAAPAAPASSAALADEIAALDHARDLLEGGHAADTLSALADFDRRFPNGALRQEATVTRIEALFKLGRATEGASLVDRFLAAHPASSHAEHLRRLVREAAPSE